MKFCVNRIFGGSLKTRVIRNHTIGTHINKGPPVLLKLSKNISPIFIWSVLYILSAIVWTGSELMVGKDTWLTIKEGGDITGHKEP